MVGSGIAGFVPQCARAGTCGLYARTGCRRLSVRFVSRRQPQCPAAQPALAPGRRRPPSPPRRARGTRRPRPRHRYRQKFCRKPLYFFCSRQHGNCQQHSTTRLRHSTLAGTTTRNKRRAIYPRLLHPSRARTTRHFLTTSLKAIELPAEAGRALACARPYLSAVCGGAKRSSFRKQPCIASM